MQYADTHVQRREWLIYNELTINTSLTLNLDVILWYIYIPVPVRLAGGVCFTINLYIRCVIYWREIQKLYVSCYIIIPRIMPSIIRRYEIQS